MIVNGFLQLTADEVATYAEATAKNHPSSWWINTTSGETHFTEGEYRADLPFPDGCVYLMGTNPLWVFQWAGNWQRACDEQLNPLLSSAFPNGVTTV